MTWIYHNFSIAGLDYSYWIIGVIFSLRLLHIKLLSAFVCFVWANAFIILA